jgi:hypothetical protein
VDLKRRGFPNQDLQRAGCFAIYRDPEELLLEYSGWSRAQPGQYRYLQSRSQSVMNWPESDRIRAAQSACREIPGSVLLLGVPTIRADKPSWRLRFGPARQQIGTRTANLAYEAAQRGIPSEGQSSRGDACDLRRFRRRTAVRYNCSMRLITRFDSAVGAFRSLCLDCLSSVILEKINRCKAIYGTSH